MYWIAHLETLVTSGYLADFKVRWSKQIHWTLWKVFVQEDFQVLRHQVRKVRMFAREVVEFPLRHDVGRV